MRLALATCADLPDWEVDDRHLHAALQARGVPFDLPIWNDPAADWGAWDAVLIRTTWDYQEHRDAFLEDLPGVDGQRARHFTADVGHVAEVRGPA